MRSTEVQIKTAQSLELISRLRRKWRVALFGCVLFALLVVLSGAAPQKHLAVYSVAANYSLPLVQRDGRDYVGLLELLEPLGRVSAKAEGSRWRLRYNNLEAIFQAGNNRAQVNGREADLGAKFLLENQ